LVRFPQVFRASSALLVVLALAGVGPSVAQNVLGLDFGSEWIKLAVVQRSAGVQIVLNEVISCHVFAAIRIKALRRLLRPEV
jgi:hypothetical protein